MASTPLLQHRDQRPRRADARRNRDRIIEAAWVAFSEHGPQLPLDQIALQAEVSPATLFRHFANREELVGAVVERRFTAVVEPAFQEAHATEDPWTALVEVIGALVRMGTSSTAWQQTLAAAREAGLVNTAIRERFDAEAGELLARAQAAGAVRPEVHADDLLPIVRMLRALVMSSSDLPPDAWRRYLELLLRPA